MTEIDTTDYATLETVDGQYQVRFTRRLAHAPEKVWRALTDELHLAHWFPTTIEGELVTGATLRFSFREHAIDPFEGSMIECDPPRVMDFMWGPDRLRIELAPDGDGTTLTLSDHVNADEQGKAARDAAGWHMSLDHLGHELAHPGDDAGRPWTDEDAFEEVNAHYRAAFPADASTIAPPQAYYDTIEAKKG